MNDKTLAEVIAHDLFSGDQIPEEIQAIQNIINTYIEDVEAEAYSYINDNNLAVEVVDKQTWKDVIPSYILSNFVKTLLSHK